MRLFTIIFAVTALVFLGGALLFTSYVSAQSKRQVVGKVNVYSSRKEELVRHLFDKFTEQTGVEVNFVTDKPAKLIARMKHEEANSPADLFLTADVANLNMAKEEGLLIPIKSKILETNVPEEFRDKSNYWYGLSVRARALVYAKDRVQSGDLSTYEYLADPEWKGRILVRSSSNVYNQSLIASMIAANGPKVTEEWAGGLVANFARKPQGGDTDQIRAVAAGEGDVAIVNSYYFGRLLASDKPQDREVIEKVAIFFPNQKHVPAHEQIKNPESRFRGTHINISGGGVTKTAVNKKNAVKLLEFLSSKDAQEIYAKVNHEFPVKEEGNIFDPKNRSEITKSWQFKMDKKPLNDLHLYHKEALRIADRVGWR